MVLPPLLLDILKYALSGIGVVMVAFYLLKPYLDRFEKLKVLEYRKNTASQTLTLKLQAYERLVLFIDRLNPANLLVRLNAPSFSAAELHAMMITEVRNEFQHNITQQIYVSEQAWGVVQRVKDDTLNLMNTAAKNLPEDTTGLELGKLILGRLAQLDANLYEAATGLLKREADQLL